MMGALAFALGWLKSGVRLAIAHPCRAACLALLVACAWLWWANGRKADTIADLRAEIAAIEQAQKDAAAKALAAKVEAERFYRMKAERADHEYDKSLAASDAALRSYVATHRLRTDAHCAASGTAPAAENHGAGVPESLPSAAFVAVSDADMQACTVWSRIGVKAVNWAATLGEQP